MAIRKIVSRSIAASAVDATALATNAVTTAKVADGAVTSVKTTGVGRSKNLIINGAMQVCERAIGDTLEETSVNSDRYSVIDRFKIMNNQAHFTVSQTSLATSATPFTHGFTKAMKLQVTTAQASPAAGDRMQIRYSFEGQDLQELRYGTSSAKSVTMSFWVKATKTGTNVLSAYQDDGGKAIGFTYTINASNTWEKKTITFPGNTADAIANDNTRGLLFEWRLGAGSNRTSGTLRNTWTAYATADECPGQVNHADSTSNNFNLTGVQLEIGSTAGDFDFESFHTTQQKCMRYFEVLFCGSNSGVRKKTTSDYSSYMLTPAICHGYKVDQIGYVHDFKVRKRAPGATMSCVSTSNDYRMRNHSASKNNTVMGSATQNASVDGIYLYLSTSGVSEQTGWQLYCHNASARITVDTEL